MSTSDEIETVTLPSGKTVARYRIIKRTAKKEPKGAADRTTNWAVEKFKSNQGRCENPECSFFMNRIEKGTMYVQVTDPSKPGPFIKGRIMPKPMKMHVECVPDEVKPMLKLIFDE